MLRRNITGQTEIISFSIDSINALVSDEIRDSIDKILEGNSSRYIIDLSGVRYIDSSGFSCLLSISRSAKRNFSTLALCCIHPEVMKVLEMLHLHTIINIYPSLEEAIASL